MRRFTILALAVAIGLGTAFSPFASSSPDGLEKVAERAGLPRPAAGSPPCRRRRRCPTTRSRASTTPRLATALAGFAGTIGVFAARRRAWSPSSAARPRDGMSGVHALESAGLAGDPASPVHRLDARAKLLGLAGLTLVAATAPRAAWPLLACCAALLGVVARRRARAGARARRGASRVVLAARGARRGVAAVRAPRRRGARGSARCTVSDAGLAVFGAAVAKAAVGTLSAVLLAATTTVPAALDGLRRLRAPALLVAIAGVTWRYVFVLAGEVARMRTALAARGHRPRHLLHGARDRPARHARCSCARTPAASACTSRWRRAAGRGVPAARRAPRARRAPTSLFLAALAGLPLAAAASLLEVAA